MVCLFLLLVVPDLPLMMRRPRARDIAVYAVVWIAGLAYSLAIANGVYPSGVNTALRAIFEPIGKILLAPPPG